MSSINIGWKKIKERLDERIRRGGDDLLLDICRILADGVSHYDWVGFYLTVPGTGTRSLRLGPFVGEATDHTEIPFGRGICGQAAERQAIFTVQDVEKEDNYLSCSMHVKSEIVVPIMAKAEVVGEIDIDSHSTALLAWLAEKIAPHIVLANG
jgi:L-methionine (R)-S-oxide reductase